LAPTIEACAEQIDRERRLPAELIGALQEAGLFRLLLPRSIGGAELEPAAFVRVVQELGKADASTGWVACQTSGCSLVAAYLAADVAQAIFGEPRGVLTWGPPAEGRAIVAEGGYRVTGKWPFASGIHHASWLGASCSTFEADGTARLLADGSPEVRTMLFPAGKAAISDVWQVIGLRGTGSDAYSVSDVFVPQAYSVARDDPAERREAGRLYRLTAQQVFEIGFAGLGLGIARGALDSFLELAGGKTPRGFKRTMRDSAVVQSQVAQAEGRLGAAEAFLIGSVEQVWEGIGAEAELLSLEQRMKLRLAASHALKEAREVVDSVFHLSGSTEIFDTSPIGRRFRDMHAVSQQLQARQDHFEKVGQFLLGWNRTRRSCRHRGRILRCAQNDKSVSRP